MFNEYLSDKYRVYTNGGSKGTQIKYQKEIRVKEISTEIFDILF